MSTKQNLPIRSGADAVLSSVENKLLTLQTLQLEASVDYWYQRGVGYKETFDWPGARHCFRQACLLEKKHWKAWLMTTYVAAHTGPAEDLQASLLMAWLTKDIEDNRRFEELLSNAEWLLLHDALLAELERVFNDDVREQMAVIHSNSKSSRLWIPPWQTPNTWHFVDACTLKQVCQFTQLSLEQLTVTALSYALADKLSGYKEYEEHRVDAYHLCHKICVRLINTGHKLLAQTKRISPLLDLLRDKYKLFYYALGHVTDFQDRRTAWQDVLRFNPKDPIAHYHLGSIHPNWIGALDSANAYSWLYAAAQLEPRYEQQAYYLESRGDAVFSQHNRDWNVVNIMGEQIGDKWYNKRIIDRDYTSSIPPYYFDDSRPLLIRSYQLALTDYYKVLTIEPENVNVKTNIARIEAWFNLNFDKAILLLTQVVDHYLHIYNVAPTRNREEYKLEIHELQEISRLGPLYQALFYRGLVRMNKADYTGAVEDFNRSHNVRQGVYMRGLGTELLYHRAEANFLLSNLADSLSDLNALADRFRYDDDRFYYRRSQVKAALGDAAGAEADSILSYSARNSEVRQQQLKRFADQTPKFLYRLQ
ncbi:hypothetical protein [Hymenobacter koreensis]|uniref:Tetratricopeptide repeat protein n=1 Tax=Hymenobacter koreensis TaxID=1084523 RepID=A0ABP8JPB9_9BACT